MVFVIAEIGVNWDGNFELVKQMMKMAKLAGFNAVKFQAFNEDIIKDHPQKMRLMKSSITEKNIEKIDSVSREIGIEWFATPMYLESIDLLKPYVNRFKIRVADGRTLFSNKPSKIVESILKTHKEVIISVEKYPPSNYSNNQNIKWLYCVAKYPCQLSDLDFTNLKLYDGFSNHCPNIIAPLKAFIKGAEVIEIHVTSDKKQNFLDNSAYY